ncbi:hypothetical protein EMIT079MI2_260053 [Bacillus sp. IT-79MI2]
MISADNKAYIFFHTEYRAIPKKEIIPSIRAFIDTVKEAIDTVICEQIININIAALTFQRISSFFKKNVVTTQPTHAKK